MNLTLKITYKENVSTVILTQGKDFIIGRSGQYHHQLEDPKASGKHCSFSFKKSRLELTDLNSKNGTYLNSIRVEQSQVFLGDEIKIGDTIITIEESQTHKDALKFLTFPGLVEDRISFELMSDFTGARVENQLKNSIGEPSSIRLDLSHIREVNVRKKIKSKIRLSKEEIHIENKFRSNVSFALDVAIFLGYSGLVTYFVIHFISPRIQTSEKAVYLLGIEGLIISIYALYNFKISKFTFGEKISGIKNIYSKQ